MRAAVLRRDLEKCLKALAASPKSGPEGGGDAERERLAPGGGTAGEGGEPAAAPGDLRGGGWLPGQHAGTHRRCTRRREGSGCDSSPRPIPVAEEPWNFAAARSERTGRFHRDARVGRAVAQPRGGAADGAQPGGAGHGSEMDGKKGTQAPGSGGDFAAPGRGGPLALPGLPADDGAAPARPANGPERRAGPGGGGCAALPAAVRGRGRGCRAHRLSRPVRPRARARRSCAKSRAQLLRDEAAYAAAVEDSQRLARERLSFSAVARELAAFLRGTVKPALRRHTRARLRCRAARRGAGWCPR